MKHGTILNFIISFLILHFYAPLAGEFLFAQDTSCGIIWHEPIVLANQFGLPSVAAQENNVYVTWDGGSTTMPFMHSTNDGEQWSEIQELWNIPGTHASRHQLVATSQWLYLFHKYINDTLAKEYIHFIKSSNEGLTWTSPKRIYPRELTFHPFSVKDDTIATAIQYQDTQLSTPVIASSTNGGDTWQFSTDTIKTGIFPACALGTGVLHLAMNAYNMPLLRPEILYWRSTDLGFSWTKKEFMSSVDGAFSMGAAIAAEGNNAFVAWRDTKFGNCFSSLGCGVVARRTDSGGEQWYEEQLLTEIQNGITPAVAMNGNVVASAWEGGNDVYSETYVRVSLDGGLSFCPVHNIGLRSTSYCAVAISENAVHVIFPNYNVGKLYYVRGEFVSTNVREESHYPQKIELLQNYPNPFNAATVISYELRVTSFVSITIYDIKGNEITSLVNKQMEAGEHSVKWNAETFPSGLYFYRLRAGTFLETKKMILVK